MAIQLEREGIRYEVVLGSRIPKLLGHDAFTYARTIYVAGDVLPPDLHAHEFQHLIQQRNLGLFTFSWRYALEARKGYLNNSFEIEANVVQRLPARVAMFPEVRKLTAA